MDGITVLNICTTELYCMQLTAYNLYQLKIFAFAIAVLIALVGALFVYNYMFRIFFSTRKW